MGIMVRQNQGSVMGFYNRVTKRQPQSQTSVTIRNCCFAGIKHLENMRLHFFRNPRTIILHAYLRFSICFSSPDADYSTWRRIFYGIIN